MVQVKTVEDKWMERPIAFVSKLKQSQTTQQSIAAHHQPFTVIH